MVKPIPTRLTLAHAAMVTAGLATFVTVGSVLRNRDAVVDVVVMADTAAAGTQANDLPLDVRTVPADTPFLDTMLEPGEVPDGQSLARSLEAGEPLMRTDLVSVGSAVLTRTATVSVDAVVINGLGLTIGDEVDVIGMIEERPAFVLTGVRITRLPSTSGADGLLLGPSDSFVTLEVDDRQALALVAALRAGPIELVRSTGAPAIVTTAIPVPDGPVTDGPVTDGPAIDSPATGSPEPLDSEEVAP